MVSGARAHDQAFERREPMDVSKEQPSLTALIEEPLPMWADDEVGLEGVLRAAPRRAWPCTGTTCRETVAAHPVFFVPLVRQA